MRWKLLLSRDADRFLIGNKTKINEEEIFDLIRKSLLKFKGESINVDIKKLKGEWEGFFRIRKGDLRVIIEFDFENLAALVEQIDWRGNAYK
ncbi:MAG: hypothetical protein COV02_01025 [Candidatus Terrybacteria bacterium CG10_big_fil_rev_8_21_14_0_10_41_10]|uniref:Type II toxin-antitoxin system RelE/ParE family toxin n=1 Tax=Candidatus Terrybacteria bacterium CG10_big_fil_rev_8_21_14_0_10_41_10 TaxID=1975026 RepID=A0A2M8LAW9_9BACT|nr:MAG: hypothetical protein COV02_01025 [Candidatus Terrybacteria bacterium CG10_big_fil_rev_8_21_14_0_10_41_10]